MIKNITNYVIYTVVVIVVIIILSNTQQYLLANILYISFLSLLLITRSDLLIFLFIVLLPTNGFIPATEKIFDFLHLSQITNLFAFFHLFGIVAQRKQKVRLLYHNFPGLKLIHMLIIYALVYYLIIEFKGLIILREIELAKLLTRYFKYLIIFIPLYLLAIVSIDNYFKQLLKSSFTFSIALIALSIILTKQLESLGVVVGQLNPEFIGDGVSYTRQSGFFADFGGAISAGGFLAIGVAFLLYEFKKSSGLNSLLISSVIGTGILGILFTVSRAPFISVVIVLIFYSFSNISRGTMYLILLFGVFGYFMIDESLFESIFYRLSTSEESYGQKALFTRGGTLIFYLEYFRSNAYLIFLGAFENPFREYVSFIRSAHNFFIQLYFYTGIMGYLALINIFLKIYELKRHFNINFIFLGVPIAGELMGVSEIPIVFPFVIILMLTMKNTDLLRLIK